jgi:hypothetical protein
MDTQKSARLAEFLRRYRKARSEQSQSEKGTQSQLEKEEAAEEMMLSVMSQMGSPETPKA